MTIEFHSMKKAGPLRNGAEWGKGSIIHAVPPHRGDCAPALCGATPAIMWSDCERREITCPRCLKKIAKAAA